MSVFSLHRMGIAGAAAAAMLSVAGAATAATPGSYVEADLGSASADINRAELDAVLEDLDFEADDTSLDKNDIGYSFAVGYQFTPNLAVEAAYLDLGKVKYEGSGRLDDGEDLFDIDFGIGLKSRGPALSVIGIWPVSNAFSVDARAGAYFGKTSVTVSASDGEESFSESLGSDSKTGLLLGVGATWSFAGNIGVRLGYTRLNDAVGERNVDRISLGLRFSF